MTRNAIRKMDETEQSIDIIENLKEKDGHRENQEKRNIFYVTMWNEEVIKIYVK